MIPTRCKDKNPVTIKLPNRRIFLDPAGFFTYRGQKFSGLIFPGNTRLIKKK